MFSSSRKHYMKWLCRLIIFQMSPNLTSIFTYINGALASLQNKTDDADKFVYGLNAKIQFLVKREVERWKKENHG